MKRKTIQRETIVKVFKELDRPLTIEEVLEHGKKSVSSLNQSTVYRNLKILVDNRKLNRIMHPKLGVLYELPGKEHHHHFCCNHCKRTYDFPGCALKETPETPGGFTIEDHEVFLFGVCRSCSAKKNHSLDKSSM